MLKTEKPDLVITYSIKPNIYAGLACSLAVILGGTLGQRTAGTARSGPHMIPFYSYYLALRGGEKELLRANFMNVALFFPAGLLVCEALPGKRRQLWTAVGLLALSLAVELCQYRFGMGLAEADDVIHNTLGVILGILTCTGRCCAPRGNPDAE